MGLFINYGRAFSVRGKVGIIQQNYNLTDGVNYGADAKRFTNIHADSWTMLKNNMSM